jgi:hypothetical protein
LRDMAGAGYKSVVARCLGWRDRTNLMLDQAKTN